jgi:hypothetical protein
MPQIETAISSSFPTGLPGIGDLTPGTDLRRISVALVCLSFALGIAGLVLLFLLARWYRIRQQKKRHEDTQNQPDEEQQMPPEHYEQNDMERQVPGIVPPARTASNRSGVSQVDERDAVNDRHSEVVSRICSLEFLIDRSLIMYSPFLLSYQHITRFGVETSKTSSRKPTQQHAIHANSRLDARLTTRF